DPGRPSLRKEGNNNAKQERSQCGRGGPAVPVHRGNASHRRRSILRMLRAQHKDSERRIDSDHRKILREGECVEDCERWRVCKCKATDRVRRHHDPKPITLFITCPTRKFHQMMKARINVSAVRVRASWSTSGPRQRNQYAGSNAAPIAAKCSLMSKRPRICH